MEGSTQGGSKLLSLEGSKEKWKESLYIQHCENGRWGRGEGVMVQCEQEARRTSQFSSSSFYFLNVFIDYAITVVPFSPFTPHLHAHPLPPTFSLFNSCLWVTHISSLASTFPILFLPSPCQFFLFLILFCNYSWHSVLFSSSFNSILLHFCISKTIYFCLDLDKIMWRKLGLKPCKYGF